MVVVDVNNYISSIDFIRKSIYIQTHVLRNRLFKLRIIDYLEKTSE